MFHKSLGVLFFLLFLLNTTYSQVRYGSTATGLGPADMKTEDRALFKDTFALRIMLDSLQETGDFSNHSWEYYNRYMYTLMRLIQDYEISPEDKKPLYLIRLKLNMLMADDYRYKLEFSTAKNFIYWVIEDAHILGDKPILAEAWYRLSEQFIWEEKEDSAIIYYKNALDCYADINDSTMIVAIKLAIGMNLNGQGKMGEALKIYSNMKDKVVMFNDLGLNYMYNLALADQNKEIGEYDTALVYYKKVVALSDTLGETNARLIALLGLSQCYICQKEWYKAQEINYKAFNILNNRSDGDIYKVRLHIASAICQVSLGDYYGAIRTINDGFESVPKQYIIGADELLYWKGVSYREIGQTQLALENFLNSHRVASYLNHPEMIADIYAELAPLYAQIRNYEKAYTSLDSSLILRDSLYPFSEYNDFLKYKYKTELEQARIVDSTATAMLHNEEVMKTNQRTERVISLSIITLLMAGLSILFYRNRAKTMTIEFLREKELKEKIEEEKSKVTSEHQRLTKEKNELLQENEELKKRKTIYADIFQGGLTEQTKARLMDYFVKTTHEQVKPNDWEAIDLLMKFHDKPLTYIVKHHFPYTYDAFLKRMGRLSLLLGLEDKGDMERKDQIVNKLAELLS